MSYVSVMTVDSDGRVETVDEVPNALRFHMAIWNGLMNIHRIPGGAFSERGTELLWSKLYEMTEHDQLIMLATFDRVWFPCERSERWPRRQGMVGALTDRLATERRFDSSARDVATILECAMETAGLVGVCFATSQAGQWNCSKTDGHHRIDFKMCRCVDCGETLQNAAHVLMRTACCEENPAP